MTTLTTDLSAGRFAGLAPRPDLAARVLRVTMGGLFLFHGGVKLFVFTAGYFESIGLPGLLAYATIAAELIGGVALIAGIWTRLVSLALVPILVGAAYFGHGSFGFDFSNQGGGWEYPAFWAVALIVQALLGGGAYALQDRIAR